MKFRGLNFRMGVLTALTGIIIITTSCNNSDNAEKNSTNGKDTTASTSTDAKTVAPAKKKGKASTTDLAADQNSKMVVDKMGYYNRTEVMPVYPGGQQSLETYINNNIEYPEDAINNNIEGVVNVQFTIDDEGNVGNAKTVGNKLGYGLEEEAVKVVSGMPKWTPGMIKGKKVKAWYTLPISYQLEQ